MNQQNDEAFSQALVPLVIGTTGHRDLVPEEVPEIRRLIRGFLVDLGRRFPDCPLLILSPLAAGSDQLVAEVAIELGLSVEVPLPFPREYVETDIESNESRLQFRTLCGLADAVYELPIAPGVHEEAIGTPGEARNRQHAQLGVFLCAHCHILLAIWDGKPSSQIGGTAQVVRFHHDDVMPGFSPPDSMSRQLLAEDESDLIYHIVVSRDRKDGAPQQGLEALNCSWFTTDEAEPRTADMPERYARIFERTSEFNRDARHFEARIREEGYLLADTDSGDKLPRETREIHRLFLAADWLAIHYQRRMHQALRIIHALAFLMGMMFLLYSDFEAHMVFLIVLIVSLGASVAINRQASRGTWHARYLEYRALAEGLRVQFYWAVAGVTSKGATKYSHDNFLQKQDVELGWIRNVMRVAGIRPDISPILTRDGVAFVLREWIGSDDVGGQLEYYRSKATRYIGRSRRIDRLGKIVGACVLVLLVTMLLVPYASIRDPLFVVLGAMLLLFSVRQSYAFRIAEKEIIKQYEFMYRIFKNARRRLDATPDDAGRRRILRALGEAALDEHAEWILLHRDRPLEQSSLWRMET